MKKFLCITGSFPIPTTNGTSVFNSLYALTLKHHAPVQLVKKEDGVHMEVTPDVLEPGDDYAFLAFLADVGKELPGQVVGELEVWWPMVVDSGPQWWSLDEAGKLFVTEGEITRGEPQPYEG
jgi:hypothetical protein